MIIKVITLNLTKDLPLNTHEIIAFYTCKPFNI